MIAGLDEDQQEKLERIMSKDLDSATEFQMLHDEFVEMGMNVQNLLDLSKMMVQFLARVPGLAVKLNTERWIHP